MILACVSYVGKDSVKCCRFALHGASPRPSCGKHTKEISQKTKWVTSLGTQKMPVRKLIRIAVSRAPETRLSGGFSHSVPQVYEGFMAHHSRHRHMIVRNVPRGEAIVVAIGVVASSEKSSWSANNSVFENKTAQYRATPNFQCIICSFWPCPN